MPLLFAKIFLSVYELQCVDVIGLNSLM